MGKRDGTAVNKFIPSHNALDYYYFKNFIGGWLTYNVVLASGLQQSEPVVHIHISIIFSHTGYYRILSRFPCAISRFLLLVSFVYTAVCIY